MGYLCHKMRKFHLRMTLFDQHDHFNGFWIYALRQGYCTYTSGMIFINTMNIIFAVKFLCMMMFFVPMITAFREIIVLIGLKS